MWLLLGRVRSALARHPRWYWATVVVLLVPTAATLRSLDEQARHRRDAWGEPAEVWVASAPAEPGDPLRAERRTVPRAVLPDRAANDDPSGRPARRVVTSGEILTELDTARSALAGSVGDGRVAVTVAQRPLPPVTAGDPVVVLLTGGGGAPVSGTVVEVTVEAITVAVDATTATSVAAEALAGTAVVALAG